MSADKYPNIFPCKPHGSGCKVRKLGYIKLIPKKTEYLLKLVPSPCITVKTVILLMLYQEL